MQIYFESLWVFSLLPLAVLPWIKLPSTPIEVRNLPIVPIDRESNLIELMIRLTLTITIISCLFGLSRPYYGQRMTVSTGIGAEIVLLLDRSRSMDQPYGKVDFSRSLIINTREMTTKKEAAKNVLSNFISNRPDDFFGLVNFSSRPIRLFPLTRNHDSIQGAINASVYGKSLAETDIAAVLLEGLSFFSNRSYTASRVLMLISDGGAQIDPRTRQEIAELSNRYQISIYWIYLRGRGSPGLSEDQIDSAGSGSVPEFFLHKYFQSIGVPYKVYEASDNDQLKNALKEIDKLQKLPTRFQVITPPKSLSDTAFLWAFVFFTPFLIFSMFEVTRWELQGEQK